MEERLRGRPLAAWLLSAALPLLACSGCLFDPFGSQSAGDGDADADGDPAADADTGPILPVTSDLLLRFSAYDEAHLVQSPAGEVESWVDLFLVMRSRDLATNGYALYQASDSTGYELTVRAPYSRRVYWDAGRSSSHGQLATGWRGMAEDYYVWNFVSNAGVPQRQEIRRNNVVLTADTNTASHMGGINTLYIGARGYGSRGEPYLPQNMNLAELMFFDRVLSDAERAAVHRYLGRKWRL